MNARSSMVRCKPLVAENDGLFRLGDEARDPTTAPGEIDADSWAENFWGEQCECRK